MEVFDFRYQLVNDYKDYVESFIQIRDPRIRDYVDQSLKEGILWPEALIQLNPSFQPGEWVDELVSQGVLHKECSRVFRKKSDPKDKGKKLRLHLHQAQAIKTAQTGESYVLTTGTGSGKSLAYIVPIVDRVIKNGSGKGIKAIIVYPMNALANSQFGELEKFIQWGYPENQYPVRFAKYTGQESDDVRNEIIKNPPDILLTNYVMLELILTRPDERKLVDAANGLEFLVLDELHTYRGRQGADVSFLVRRVREALGAYHLQCIGTSATLAGGGTFKEQQEEVARVASQIFGTTVQPDNIIGETLKRVTPEIEFDNIEFVHKLKSQLSDNNYTFPTDFNSFVNEPLSIWLESTFGVSTEEGTNRLVRSIPKSISGEEGAAKNLNLLTGTSEDTCADAIKNGLIAGNTCETNPETNFPPFAFRLHQFISRGDAVYASLEPEDDRYLTINRQQFVPGDRNRILLPLAFCRECGQEYYSIRLEEDSEGKHISARDLTDQQSDEDNKAGFLYLSKQNPWPIVDEELINRLPDDWIEAKDERQVVRKNRKKFLPQNLQILTNGNLDEKGRLFQYVDAPFKFCMNCGVSYGIRQRSDFAKLSTLSSEGRSTATTILSLSSIRYLQNANQLDPKARKLLSFTDNRQDASLQAGHFNDFIEIGVLRSALYRAVSTKGQEGLSHDDLTMDVFKSMNLPFDLYAAKPGAQYAERTNTEKAFRNVLGYRLYRDLKRGWRITSPNLEQCGLLEIAYSSLTKICDDDKLWNQCHPAIATATTDIRFTILKVLLDYMRRELAIRVDYLDTEYQEKIQQQSSQYLVSPWAVDEDEKMIHASVLYPRSKEEKDCSGNVFLSARGGFGMFLRRTTTFQDYKKNLNLEETLQIIKELLLYLAQTGLLEIVDEPRDENQVPGYQLSASSIVWLEGDGARAFHDPIRVPNQPEWGGRTNPYFLEYYRKHATGTYALEAREHTAQVPYEDRITREDKFREAKLPILYCSPTMELGVDIAELNVVNMRNVPPTPANYAQRSGRAGRSGQPAMVYTYCTTGSPHDQFFFKRPELMVAGNVTPPRMDLANEDLIKAHIHSIWLAETEQSLGKSLKDILDLSGDEPSLELKEDVRDSIRAKDALVRAKNQAEQILLSVQDELENTDWYHDKWLDNVLNNVVTSFDLACNRWRNLYRSALAQAQSQDQIIRDATRNQSDKRRAERLRYEAESQLKLLTEISNVAQSDFYSYRYFGSEGFLPGYSFPRLPLSAYIPGRHTKQRDEFLSRSRFLAISEFGPQAIVYHEGSRYVINKVILPVHDENLNTGNAKICSECGYLHPISDGVGPELCEMCHSPLDESMEKLFRLQNVSTKRRDRITSDEEERMRMGYELLTSVRFNQHGGNAAYLSGWIESDGQQLANLCYGHTATIWRVNLGWKRRKNRSQFGFMLDTERGYWEKNEHTSDNDNDEAFSRRRERVVPYVEDRRNSLIIEPIVKLDLAEMASLQSALKAAIQVEYQLEDQELAVEPLPNYKTRNRILIYEAAEGGAGVLRRLLYDPQAFNRVARAALEICHFDPQTGRDLRRAPRANEDCEAACYNCLLNYGNQPDHEHLDRHKIVQILIAYSTATIHLSPIEASREDHLQNLLKLCDSELERNWLLFLQENQQSLPSDAQQLITKCETRPDFLYKEHKIAIYIDGPHHDYPERKQRDQDKSECLEDAGYMVIRFGHQEEWLKKIKQYPNVFGSNK